MEPSEASLIPENPSKSQNDAELGHPSSLYPPPSNGDPDPAPSDLHHAEEDVKLLSEELRDLYLKEQQEAVLELGLIGNEKRGINGGEENMIGYGSENGNDSENEVGNAVDEVIEKKDGGFISRNYQYPVRPEAEDCAFYMKTGTCKFGSNCKFNHPVRRKTNLVYQCISVLILVYCLACYVYVYLYDCYFESIICFFSFFPSFFFGLLCCDFNLQGCKGEAEASDGAI